MPLAWRLRQESRGAQGPSNQVAMLLPSFPPANPPVPAPMNPPTTSGMPVRSCLESLLRLHTPAKPPPTAAPHRRPARWREHVAVLQYVGRLARQPARPFADHRVLAAGPARGLPGPAAGPVGAAARIRRPLLHPLPPLLRHPRIAPHRAEAHTDRMNPRAAGAARPTSSPPNGTTPARPDHDRFETFYFFIRGGPPCGMTAGYFATRRRRRDRPAAVAAR